MTSQRRTLRRSRASKVLDFDQRCILHLHNLELPSSTNVLATSVFPQPHQTRAHSRILEPHPRRVLKRPTAWAGNDPEALRATKSNSSLLERLRWQNPRSYLQDPYESYIRNGTTHWSSRRLRSPSSEHSHLPSSYVRQEPQDTSPASSSGPF